MQKFMAVNGIVAKALDAKWSDEAVTAALAKIGTPVVAWKLQQELERSATAHGGRGMNFDTKSRRR